MESTSVSGSNFVSQILQKTVSTQIEADKKRLLALIQIKAQQTAVEQKVNASEGSLDVYA